MQDSALFVAVTASTFTYNRYNRSTVFIPISAPLNNLESPKSNKRPSPAPLLNLSLKNIFVLAQREVIGVKLNSLTDSYCYASFMFPFALCFVLLKRNKLAILCFVIL